MTSLYYNDNHELQVYAGSSINSAIADAIALCLTDNGEARFTFNEVEITCRGDSDPRLLQRDFHRAMARKIGKAVGPYPKAELTAEELANDAKVEAENKARWAARQAEYDARQKRKADELAALLEAAPPLALSDPDGWEKARAANQDGYGGAVITYAEAWGRLMQRAMVHGEQLESVAGSLSHMADAEGITGFQYGCAVSILSQVWEHGDRLRRWHNGDTQIGDEGDRANETGGVLNPALLSIG